MKALLKIRCRWSKFQSIFRTRRKKLGFFSLLSNDIVMEILYRVPADTVLSSKRVCKNWYHIITSEDFAKNHLKRAKAVNLTVFRFIKRYRFSMERDTKGILRLKNMDIIEPGFNSNILELRVIESCNGLLLIRYDAFSAPGPLFKFGICNPITGEVVPFIPLEQGVCGEFYVKLTTQQRTIVGFFYDEVTSEYKLLLFQLHKYDRNNVTYYVYGWRSKVEKKLCTNMLSPIYYYDNTTIAVGRLVCWRVSNGNNDGSYVSRCSKCIMMFKMDDETLHYIPHPETMNCKWNPCAVDPHENMRLLDLDGNLGVAFSFATIITIWCLEDSVNFTWVVCHEIDFGPELNKYPTLIKYGEFHTAEVLNLIDGELVFLLRSKGLFSRNLRSKVTNKLKVDNVKRIGSQALECSSVLHLKSLISPREAFG